MKSLFLCLVVLAASVSAAFAQSGQVTFSGGATNVRFSSDLSGALTSLGITVSPTKAAGGVRGGNANFPITWGTVDAATLRGEIMHSQYLLFHRGGSSVRVEGFIIDTTGPQALINGLASANGSVVGRIPLFNVDLSAAQISQVGAVLQISNVRLTLRPEAAAAFNSVFQTSAFVAGFPVGTASVSAIVSQGQ